MAIVFACCILHNFIMCEGGDELIVPEKVWVALNYHRIGLDDVPATSRRSYDDDDDDLDDQVGVWVEKREEIARAMWENRD